MKEFQGKLPATERLPDEESTYADHGTETQVANRFGLDLATIKQTYVNPGERLTGFGNGGSESLVMFLDCPRLGKLVRKVCAETLATVPWDPDGSGVMTPPSTKGGLQADYLRGLPDEVQPYFPKVHGVRVLRGADPGGVERRELIIDQSMISGREMSAFIAAEQPDPRIVKHLHATVMKLLSDKVHPHRQTLHTGDSVGPSHLDKIVARLELSRETTPQTFGPLLDSETIIVNGTEYRNIGPLLDFFRQPHVADMLEPRTMSLVMGDTNTENVMITRPDVLLDAMAQLDVDFTYDDLGLRFLDPRAIGHESSGSETVDDRMYDNKPLHNTLGNYDIVHGEHFDIFVGQLGAIPSINLRAHKDNPYGKSYADIYDSDYLQYVLEGWGVDNPEFQASDPNWLLRFTFMMGSHFAAMPPFHFKKGEDGTAHEDPEMQKRAIAIYCEGIKWLNRAYDMINGDLRSLYGIPLSPLASDNRK